MVSRSKKKHKFTVSVNHHSLTYIGIHLSNYVAAIVAHWDLFSINASTKHLHYLTSQILGIILFHWKLGISTLIWIWWNGWKPAISLGIETQRKYIEKQKDIFHNLLQLSTESHLEELMRNKTRAPEATSVWMFTSVYPVRAGCGCRRSHAPTPNCGDLNKIEFFLS